MPKYKEQLAQYRSLWCIKLTHEKRAQYWPLWYSKACVMSCKQQPCQVDPCGDLHYIPVSNAKKFRKKGKISLDRMCFFLFVKYKWHDVFGKFYQRFFLYLHEPKFQFCITFHLIKASSKASFNFYQCFLFYLGWFKVFVLYMDRRFFFSADFQVWIVLSKTQKPHFDIFFYNDIISCLPELYSLIKLN